MRWESDFGGESPIQPCFRTFSSKVKVSRTAELMVEGDLEKPEEFCRIMEEANLSLCCVSELRWKGAGEVRVGTHTFLFSGLEEAAPKSEQGVGIVLNDEINVHGVAASRFFLSIWG